jgi:tRNA nucleotidyltransferase (CCA-adding enzyme)
LGKSPRDIDVVLQNITPKEFVQSLIDHHSFDSHSARLLPSTIDVSQSTGDASDLSIGTYDFEYDSGDGKTFQVAGIYFFSLTMKMEFTQLKASQRGGDIELLTQDAMQRELTINAIYQKLSTSEILDFTGRGIDDLRKRVLRCPRGKQNIVDDPLRVLRIIRLASRFFFEGFVIEKETLDAMMDPDIRVCTLVRMMLMTVGVEDEIPHRADP